MKWQNCGKEISTLIKEWNLSPKVHAKLYDCARASILCMHARMRSLLHETKKREF
jgi:hypothetical protein